MGDQGAVKIGAEKTDWRRHRNVQDKGSWKRGNAELPADSVATEVFRLTAAEDGDITFASDPNARLFEQARPAPDGGVLLAPGSDPQETVYGTLIRLQPNGGVDAGFQIANSIRNAQVVRQPGTLLIESLSLGSRVLAIQADGKIIYEYFASDAYNSGSFYLVRLNADGSIDPAFSATQVPTVASYNFPQVYDPVINFLVQPLDGARSAPLPWEKALIQADGKIVVIGGTAADIFRLNANGSRDNSFNVGAGPQWTQTAGTAGFFPIVEDAALQSDGKLLLVGTFEAFNGIPAPGIVSLNSNGTVDSSLPAIAVRQRFSPLVTRLERQTDGSFVLSGAYSFPGETEPRLIHVNSSRAVPSPAPPQKIERKVPRFPRTRRAGRGVALPGLVTPGPQRPVRSALMK